MKVGSRCETGKNETIIQNVCCVPMDDIKNIFSRTNEVIVISKRRIFSPKNDGYLVFGNPIDSEFFLVQGISSLI